MNPTASDAEVAFAATYFTGRLTTPRPVQVRLIDGAWHVSAESGELLVSHPLDLSRISERLADVPRLITLPDGGSLETAPNPLFDSLVQPSRSHQFSAWVHRLESHARIAAAATVLMVAVVGAAFKFGLPRLARNVAAALPTEVEQHIGEASLATFQTWGVRTGLDRTARARVRTQLNRIVREGETCPTVHFRNLGNLANAFALPGNVIVVTDALPVLLSDDEIAAVFAHEMGHLEARHAEQQILLGSTSLLLIAAATGDLSVLTSFAGALPLSLLQSGYSREFERDADRLACERLAAADLDPTSLAAALEHLEQSLPGAAVNFSYLSTHPSSAERMARIRAFGRETQPAH